MAIDHQDPSIRVAGKADLTMRVLHGQISCGALTVSLLSKHARRITIGRCSTKVTATSGGPWAARLHASSGGRSRGQ